jgi:dTDP-4-dehydrorhamnose 3,5-epimerase
MKARATILEGLMVIDADVFADARGWFMETYSTAKMEALGIKTVFVQDNQSFSQKKGTIRGLHFQNEPMAQSKLVRCTNGSIFDVAVDIRRGSPTYCKWVGVELSPANKCQLFVPKGFAHGFVTKEEGTEVQYKVDNFYSKEHDRAIRYNDPSIAVDWGESQPILSEKDLKAPLLSSSDCNFVHRPR